MTRYNWERIAKHYRLHRAGPPNSYYELLRCFDLGQPGQQVLDIGTGPGSLACQFSRQGANVIGIDASDGQIEQAKVAARKANLNTSFITVTAEALPQLEQPIDLAVANMCWGYLNHVRVLDRLIPQMAENGRLVLSTFRWLVNDTVSELTTMLLTDLGIEMQRATRPLGGKPRINDPRLHLWANIYYEQAIPFDIDTWVGRQLASRAFSSLNAGVASQVAERLREGLHTKLGTHFNVTHGIEIQIFGRKSRSTVM